MFAVRQVLEKLMALGKSRILMIVSMSSIGSGVIVPRPFVPSSLKLIPLGRGHSSVSTSSLDLGREFEGAKSCSSLLGSHVLAIARCSTMSSGSTLSFIFVRWLVAHVKVQVEMAANHGKVRGA